MRSSRGVRQETGNATTCYCTMAMDNGDDNSVDKKHESDVKWTALTMYMSQCALFRDKDTLWQR